MRTSVGSILSASLRSVKPFRIDPRHSFTTKSDTETALGSGVTYAVDDSPTWAPVLVFAVLMPLFSNGPSP